MLIIRDFEDIADTIAYQYNQVAGNEAEQEMVFSVAESLADAFDRNYISFDRARFMQAACPNDK